MLQTYFPKILRFLVGVFVIVSLTFILSHVIPGDPFSDEKPLSEQAERVYRQVYGLDQPLYYQFFTYLGRVLKGDLGPSLIYQGVTATGLILESFPISCLLGFSAFLFALAGAFFLNFCALIWQNKGVETAILSLTVVMISVPSFIAATLLQYYLAVYWPLFPVGQIESVSHLFLPTLALSLNPLAFLTKQLHHHFKEILEKEYIITAKVKKLSSLRIAVKHVLPNALLPLLSYFGQLFSNILTGSFLVEKIFAIPGLGFWLVGSVMGRDYPLILGMTLFYSVVLLFLNLVFDALHRAFDPRLRWIESLESSYSL